MSPTVTGSSSGLLDLLFEDPQVGRCLVAPDGLVLRANAEWLRATRGLAGEAAGADPLATAPAPGDAAEALHALARTGARVEIPRHARRLGGAETSWEGTIDPVPLPGGTGLLLTARDVTRLDAAARALAERERAEQALSSDLAAEDRLAKVSASVPGAVYTFRLRPDGTACLPFGNRAVEDVFGLPAVRLAEDATPLFARIHPDDLGSTRASIAESARTLVPWRGVFRYHHPAKGLRWIDGSSVPQAEEDGGVVWHGFSKDVTERRLAELALAESEELYRSLFGLTPSGVVLLDDAGRFEAFNDQACRQLGYTREEFARLTVADIDVAERSGEAVAHPGRISAAGGDQFAARHRAKSGEIRDVLVSSRPVVRKGRPHFVAVWQDTTERTRAAAALQEGERRQRLLEEQFHQAQKLESVGRLAGGVAHDFNNLLTVISSCAADLLSAPEPDPATRREEAEEILAAAQRATELTRQLLAFARKQVIAPVPLDLNVLLRGMERMLRRLLGEDVALSLDLAPGLPAVRCDPGQMEQVVMNLAVNARDAMPRGGTLALQTREAEVRAEEAGPGSDLRPGRWVRLLVRDSGTGMVEEVRRHVFEPFFTTKASGSGTGLGLATVHGIVGQAGGHVHVESAPGAGTSFIICLPPTAEAPHRAPPPPPAPVRGAETVLVVEDDPHVRRVTVRTLEGAGHRVLAAASGEEALAVARGHPGPIDLVVTDVVMPGRSGRAVVGDLERVRPGIRALYVSGYTQDAIVSQGVLDEGIQFLAKPFTPAALLGRVRQVLGAPAAAATRA